MKLGNSGKCPDDVPDDICHLPAKSHPKSHSRVNRRSSACHPQVICTLSALRPHEILTGNIFPLKEQTALLKIKLLCHGMTESVKVHRKDRSVKDFISKCLFSLFWLISCISVIFLIEI